MALVVTHGFTSAIADDASAQAAGEVLPSHWNADHTLTGTVAVNQGGTGVTSIGSDTQVLFNDGGVVGADGGLTYNKTTDSLSVSGDLVVTGQVKGASASVTATAHVGMLVAASANVTSTANVGTLTVGALPVTVTDAGFDVVSGWDDSAGAHKNFLLADIATEAAPANGDFLLAYGAEGDLRKVDWASLPSGSGSPGGADTNVQFNSGGSAFGGHAGLTYATASSKLTVGGELVVATGSITANRPALDITQTWNATASTFTAVKLNVTNTLSAADSLLMDLQASGNSVYKFGAGGIFEFGKTGGIGIEGSDFAAALYIRNTGTTRTFAFYPDINEVRLRASSLLGFTSSIASDPLDTYLVRDAAGSLGLLQGTASAASFRVYNIRDNTSGAPTNYERGVFDWTTTANVLTIGTQAGGTGSARAIKFVTAGTYSDITFDPTFGFGYDSGRAFQTGSGGMVNVGATGIVVDCSNSKVAVGTGYCFQSSFSATFTNVDTALLRVSAGLLAVTDGTTASAGVYRDLQVRKLEAASASITATAHCSMLVAASANITATCSANVVLASAMTVASGISITKRILETEVTLASAATVALDASLGNTFRLLSAANNTIGVPSNKPAAGQAQKFVIIHEASGADRTLSLTTGSAGAFRFGTDITALTATTNGLADYIGCIYNQSDDRWDVVSYVKGF